MRAPVHAGHDLLVAERGPATVAGLQYCPSAFPPAGHQAEYLPSLPFASQGSSPCCPTAAATATTTTAATAATATTAAAAAATATTSAAPTTAARGTK